MKEITLFISQPMCGKSEEEILMERFKAIWRAEQITGCSNITALENYFPLNKNKHPLYVIGRNLELMSYANAAYFVKDWGDYRGCIIERLCAALYGIKILEG